MEGVAVEKKGNTNTHKKSRCVFRYETRQPSTKLLTWVQETIERYMSTEAVAWETKNTMMNKTRRGRGKKCVHLEIHCLHRTFFLSRERTCYSVVTQSELLCRPKELKELHEKKRFKHGRRRHQSSLEGTMMPPYSCLFRWIKCRSTTRTSLVWKKVSPGLSLMINLRVSFDPDKEPLLFFMHTTHLNKNKKRETDGGSFLHLSWQTI